MSETQAAKSEPLTEFPWTGFYGGKVVRITIDYADQSSRILGDPESLDVLEQEYFFRRAAAPDLYEALKDLLDHGELEGDAYFFNKARSALAKVSPQARGTEDIT